MQTSYGRSASVQREISLHNRVESCRPASPKRRCVARGSGGLAELSIANLHPTPVPYIRPRKFVPKTDCFGTDPPLPCTASPQKSVSPKWIVLTQINHLVVSVWTRRLSAGNSCACVVHPLLHGPRLTRKLCAENGLPRIYALSRPASGRVGCCLYSGLRWRGSVPFMVSMLPQMSAVKSTCAPLTDEFSPSSDAIPPSLSMAGRRQFPVLTAVCRVASVGSATLRQARASAGAEQWNSGEKVTETHSSLGLFSKRESPEWRGGNISR